MDWSSQEGGAGTPFSPSASGGASAQAPSPANSLVRFLASRAFFAALSEGNPLLALWSPFCTTPATCDLCNRSRACRLVLAISFWDPPTITHVFMPFPPPADAVDDSGGGRGLEGANPRVPPATYRLRAHPRVVEGTLILHLPTQLEHTHTHTQLPAIHLTQHPSGLVPDYASRLPPFRRRWWCWTPRFP